MARPEKFPIKKVIGFDQEMMDAIDAYRRNQSPLPNASEAVRTILADWLTKNGYLPGQEGTRPEDLNASNDD